MPPTKNPMTVLHTSISSNSLHHGVIVVKMAVPNTLMKRCNLGLIFRSMIPEMRHPNMYPNEKEVNNQDAVSRSVPVIIRRSGRVGPGCPYTKPCKMKIVIVCFHMSTLGLRPSSQAPIPDPITVNTPCPTDFCNHYICPLTKLAFD